MRVAAYRQFPDFKRLRSIASGDYCAVETTLLVVAKSSVVAKTNLGGGTTNLGGANLVTAVFCNLR